MKISVVMVVMLLCFPAGLGAMSRTGPVHFSHPLVSYVTGDVAVKGRGPSVWEPVEKGTLLLSGDEIRTESNGRAQIRFASGTIELYEGTEIQIPTTGNLERRKDIRDVMVKKGRVLVDIGVTEDEGAFRFRTPNAHGLARGSMITVSYLEAGTAVNVYRGEARVSYQDGYGERISSLVPGSSLRVEKGESLGRMVGFDPRSADRNYRKNILPDLDLTSGLPAGDKSAREESEQGELRTALKENDPFEGSVGDRNSKDADSGAGIGKAD